MSMLNWLMENAGRTYGNFINGEWKPCLSGKTVPLYHSANTEELLGYFQNSSKDDVNAAVEAANQAFHLWSKTPAPARVSILLKFADLLERDSDELSYRLSAEQGKTLAEARGEIARAVKEVQFSAGEALRVEGKTLPSERAGVANAVVYHPIGVIAAIAPWNFPIVTPIRKIAPALAYGCTVVFKPASSTPWATVKLMELLSEAGVPAGVVNMVTGSGSEVGDPLVQHPLVKGISFTGSTKQGIAINKIAAGRLARTQLELGGKNPAVVLPGANLGHAAAQIISAAFNCSGQRCTAISRVIVVKELAEALKEELIKRIKKLRVGPAWEEGVDVGPLINRGHLESVIDYIRIGKEEGAQLAIGGELLREGTLASGNYLSPALFVDVRPEMRIAREEIFGPVLSLITVENEEEALRVANDSPYGLAASVFTDQLTVASRFAEQLECGMVHINHGTASAAHMPFGGVKHSGFGSYSIGSTNRDFFMEMKVLYVQY